MTKQCSATKVTQKSAPQGKHFPPAADAQVDFSSENPCNLPDWRDASAYPASNVENNYMWRWEFLRRHKAYQGLWLVHQLRSDIGNLSPERVAELREKGGRPFGLDYLVSPACPYSSFIDELMKSWKAFRLLDDSEFLEDFCNYARSDGHLVVSIDLTVPPKRYLKDLEHTINRHVRDIEAEVGCPIVVYPNQRQQKLMHDYLRVLDAQAWKSKDSERTWGDVADGLNEADESKVIKRRDKAAEWCHLFATIPYFS